MLSAFLNQHRFSDDVCKPQKQSGCFPLKERWYPIHVAAATGDHEMVRALLEAGADPTQKTSRGRTAVDFATKGSRLMSEKHQATLALLQSEIKVLNIRQVHALIGEQVPELLE
mmetsp:Transcript_15049/g.26068  ORF Transcript_15049/g.26068 Transcript_15049/m.26068 type:complete len:114 (+) Transcript_15049:133-474(+)